MVEQFKMNANNVYGVILAGGSGERLWPLSTREKPKQLLTIKDNKTLLSQTFERLAYVVDKERIWVTTFDLYTEFVSKITSNIISEPASRNTASAILLSCFSIYKLNPDAVITFLPADHYIPESHFEVFAKALEQIISFSQSNSALTLLGICPAKPATGYGYIEYNEVKKNNLYKVQLFHEKPSLTTAKKYVSQKTMLWNTGIFCGKVQVFLKEFKKHAPAIFYAVKDFIKTKKGYETIPSISIDHAVVEKTDATWVLPVKFDWYDVGTIESFLSLKNQHSKDKVISIDAHNNLVEVPNKLVALVGVDDICVVEVNNALLIIKRNQVENVRSVVQNLKKHKQSEYL